MHNYMIGILSGRTFFTDTTENWPFACEFSIWNASVAALQCWTEELDPQTLSTAFERVYTTFFYSESAQHLQQVLFSCFITTLNDAFKRALTSADIAYESGSENMNVPTPLCHAP